ncbi:NfeD family protein [Serpentinicella sp. ANB-PHB4]|uniref:NfeD family protein n=1 Tax=Serpentinicella sp. ANB-PHB4 TaxID=3074076 RepID=UPI002862080B|nr:NfeD family protein [Serpentinicella sp. ANB-PHB4]MDR5657978.1 NfeD family protein [Serpentinicella sp. ANB-PHB4]
MAKKLVKFILIIVVVFSIMVPNTYSEQDEQSVYIIPIRGEIGPAMSRYVKNSIEEIESNNNVTAIIFEIDTYGGRIDSAEEISMMIKKSNIPTITLVNTKAESAGVLLTISGDNIAMAPGSTIGSAETIPNTEKVLSMWVSMLRSVAIEQGRDPDIIASMADKSIYIPEVIEEGRLLNLTAREALDLNITDIVASEYDKILDEFNIEYTIVKEMDIARSVLISQILSSSTVAPILLTLGFIGLVIEIFTAGFGLGGTISLVSFALYFGGSILAGNASFAVLLIFVVGLILLGIEAIAPGFGIPGVGGITAIVISIILASSSTTTAVISLIVAFTLSIVTFIILLKYGPKNIYFNKIILNENLDKEKGYSSSSDQKILLNKTGIVVKTLRPSGKVEIDNELIDVVAEEGFVDIDSEVKVVKVEGSKIVVRKIN